MTKIGSIMLFDSTEDEAHTLLGAIMADGFAVEEVVEPNWDEGKGLWAIHRREGTQDLSYVTDQEEDDG